MSRASFKDAVLEGFRLGKHLIIPVSVDHEMLSFEDRSQFG